MDIHFGKLLECSVQSVPPSMSLWSVAPKDKASKTQVNNLPWQSIGCDYPHIYLWPPVALWFMVLQILTLSWSQGIYTYRLKPCTKKWSSAWRTISLHGIQIHNCAVQLRQSQDISSPINSCHNSYHIPSNVSIHWQTSSSLGVPPQKQTTITLAISSTTNLLNPHPKVPSLQKL